MLLTLLLLASAYLAREGYELRRDWKPIAAAPGAIDSIEIAIPPHGEVGRVVRCW